MEYISVHKVIILICNFLTAQTSYFYNFTLNTQHYAFKNK